MLEKIFPVILAALCLVGCRKNDFRTTEISVPGLKNAECARILQESFLKHPGVKKVEPDFERRGLQITYDSMVTALKNLETTIAGAGFDANDISAPPDVRAGLPPECLD